MQHTNINKSKIVFYRANSFNYCVRRKIMIILLPEDLEHDQLQVEIKADTALVVQGLESLESEM